MQLSNTRKSAFRCNSKLSKNVSSLIYYNIPLAAVDAECHKLKIEARDLERKVLKILREKAELMGAEETKVENKQEQEISALEGEKCSLYDQFVDGDISRDDFKRENAKLSAEIEKLQSLQKVLAVQDAAQRGMLHF